MKVKVIKPFKDKVEGVARKPGDTFTVTEERYKELASTKLGALVEEATEEVAKPKPKKKPKK